VAWTINKQTESSIPIARPIVEDDIELGASRLPWRLLGQFHYDRWVAATLPSQLRGPTKNLMMKTLRDRAADLAGLKNFDQNSERSCNDTMNIRRFGFAKQTSRFDLPM
jgi:hypothetical protein